MRTVALRILFAITIIIPYTARAHEAEPPPAAVQITPETLMFSVVKIVNSTADIFTAERGQGHGTGFFVGLNAAGRGVIFTNRHVIEGGPTQAQRLMVEFNTPQNRGETIKAKLRFVSSLHDFAVLEFDPAELKRAVLGFPLRLPQPGTPFFEFARNSRMLRGRPVMAIGNPYDGSNVFTYGEITGMHFDGTGGPYIQTQTPINPGNSGGPLLSTETGEVLGINTAKLMGADNVGYVTPIGPLLKEYDLYLKQRAGKVSPNASEKRIQPATVAAISEGTLKVVGQYDAIERAMPGYWNEYESALIIADTQEGSGLQKDDILLELDGTAIGGVPYNLFKRLQRSGEVVQMTVLRGQDKVTVEVPFKSLGYNEKRIGLDYAYVSGLMFRELDASSPGKILPGVDAKVYVSGLIQSSATSFIGHQYPPPGSLLRAVNFGGEDIPVKSLHDLKSALNANRDKTFIRMRLHRANGIMTKAGVQMLRSLMTGAPLIDGQLATYVIPMREVITPLQFSIKKFREQFGFEDTDAATWDWRDSVKRDRLAGWCAKELGG